MRNMDTRLDDIEQAFKNYKRNLLLLQDDPTVRDLAQEAFKILIQLDAEQITEIREKLHDNDLK